MTSKLHGVCDSKGGPLRLHLREGQCSDFTGAADGALPTPPGRLMAQTLALQDWLGGLGNSCSHRSSRLRLPFRRQDPKADH